MRLLPFLFVLAGVIWLGPVAARAQMLTGTLLPAAGDTVNLNASYGFAAYTTTNGVPYTDLSNLGNFSPLSGTINPDSSTDPFYGSQIALTFTGYQSGSPATATAETVLIDANAGKTLSITSTFFTTAETFDFYVGSYTGSTTLTAVLSGPGISSPVTYSESSVLSPTNAGSNLYGYGDLNLAVSGAQIGDTLTFSIEDTNFGYAGLQGVAVVAGAPEPSTWAMLLGGAALLLAWRGRQRA
jgi:hypothetical protein